MQPPSLAEAFLKQGDFLHSCCTTIRVPILPKMSKDIFEGYWGLGPVLSKVSLGKLKLSLKDLAL